MSDSVRHKRQNDAISTIEKLKLKQKQLELQALLSTKPEHFRKFTAHPNSIQRESDTVTSHSARAVVESSFPACNKQSGQNLAYRKQKAKDFHRFLHEKLTMIDNNPSDRSEYAGDLSTQDLYQRNERNRSFSSSESLSDLDKDYLNVRCKSSESRPNSKAVNNGAVRKSAASRASSQQGLTESAFEKKLNVLVMRCLKYIAEIKNILIKGVPLPDGDDDKLRRQGRAKEFSNRFSRNYVYPIATQISNLIAMNQANPLVINQKLLSVYQIIQNALIAYHNYLPQSSEDSTHDKLKVVLGYVKKIGDIHKDNLKNPKESYLVEFIETFVIHAEVALLTITDLTKVSNKAKNTVEQSKVNLIKSKEVVVKNGLMSKQEKRLSMYRTESSSKRGKLLDKLTKKKALVQSRYKTATYKHRPPIQKEPEIISASKLRTFVHTKLENARQTRLNTPVNEDSIKTMVEAQENEKNHHFGEEELQIMEEKTDVKENGCSAKEEMLMKLLQLTMKNNNIQSPLEETKTQISELLTMMIQNQPNNANFLQEIFGGMTNNNDEEKKSDDNKQQLTLEIKNSTSAVDSGGSGGTTKRREPKVTVSGEKNARLICITDDNSLLEPKEDKNEVVNELLHQVENHVNENLESDNNIPIRDVESSKKIIKKKITKTTKKPKQPTFVKISRLKKAERRLKPLEKQQAISAIQYKLNFFKYCKSNLMYKKSANCHPWQVMSRIAEELLNDSLLTIAREIEVNDVVEKVYRGELQL